jgi:hypothetical protein
MFRIAIVCVVSMWAVTASAQDWAEKMFAQRSHDFGNVPRAAKVEFPFVITNPYNQDIHIVAVRASCGCTMPRIANDTIKPNEQGAIIAEFNTRAFTGQHGARVTVTIDRPQYAEVQLSVKGYIRTDIVLDPSQVSLGSVAQGQPAEKTIRIEHAGREDWKITNVVANSPYLTASVKEAARTPGRVSYELAVQLKPDAPAGYIKDELHLSTNDRRATEFPVAVEGLIVSDLTVSPTSLMLGTVQPGQKVTKQVVLKGAKPFRIVDVRCDNAAFSFATSNEAKILHLVPVTYTATASAGKFVQKIEFVTDLGDNKAAELTAVGQVSEPLAGK